MDTPDLPRAHGEPLGHARLRATPEDFRVDEVLGFEPTGQGEHLFLWVEKREWNTDAVAGQLARRLGVGKGAVSYAGMKDKRAVTRQWFSVHLPRRELALEPGEFLPGIRILRALRHDKKLRRGVLRGNRFRLRLREVTAPAAVISRRLARIGRLGVPNFFGEQRFGRDGDNVDQARAMFAGSWRPRDRALRGILLSSVRSQLFNQVLARRLRDGSWQRPLEGELVMLDGRHSLFPIESADEDIRRRFALLDLHATGPLVGAGGPQPSLAAALLEAEALAGEADLIQGLLDAGLEGARRALRLRVGDLAWSFPAPGELELGFSLSAGAYATVVVRELFETL